MKTRKLLPAVFAVLAILSCDRSKSGDVLSSDGTVTIAPRIVTANGEELPRVDSVRVVVLNAKSPTAAPYYESSVPWDAHGDTIRGIPADAQVKVALSGVVIQKDGTRSIWWSGSATATFSGTQIFSAQSLPVPVAVGDTAKPVVTLVSGDTIQATDTTLRLVWKVVERESFHVTINGVALPHRGDSVVWDTAWATGPQRRVIAWFRDSTGNLSIDTLLAVRRPRVSMPSISVASGTFVDTLRVALADTTHGASIEYSLDSGTSWKTYQSSLLLGQDARILARATKKGWTTSATAQADYAIRAAAPVLSIPDGTDTNDLIALRMSTLTPRGGIEYSLDSGKTWVAYKDSLKLGKTLQLWTRTVKTGLATSVVNKALYRFALSAPTFVPLSGTASNDLLAVKLGSRTPAVKYEVSLDSGKTWVAYRDSIVLGKSVEIQSRATKTGANPSAITKASYTIQAAAPTFSKETGTSWNDLLAMRIVTKTPGATIEYSFDSAKTWQVYKDSILVGKTVQVQARATKNGLTTSGVSTVSYIVRVATPTFVARDTVSNDLLTVKLACVTPGASFEVSTNGTSWSTYKDSVVLGSTTTLWARASKTGVTTSSPTSTRYAVRAAAPTITASSTSSNDYLTVKLSSATPKAGFEYSLNNGVSWIAYVDSIMLAKSVDLQARTIKAGLATSTVSVKSFSIAIDAPVFSADTAKSWNDLLTVKLSSATSGAKFEISLNGTTWQPYADSMVFGRDTTVWARAYKAGTAPSLATKASYRVRAAAPTLSHTEGEYDSVLHVTIAAPVNGDKIHYTCDGSTPSMSSRLVSGVVVVDSSCKLRARVIKTGLALGEISSADYLLRTKPVTIFVPSGAWPPFKIGMSCSTGGAIIYYTTDGSSPDVTDSIYKDSLTFGAYDDSVMLRAVAISPNTKINRSVVTTSHAGSVVPWKSGITYETLVDKRDGQSYRTVLIGGKYWMAQNLNYDTAKSFCYGDDPSMCRKFGRLYRGDEAMSGSPWGAPVQSSVRGVCPAGWHIPSNTEWQALFSAVGGLDVAGVKLKSISGWSNAGNGADAYGFRIIPGGHRNSGDHQFFELNLRAGFWSSEKSNGLWWSDWVYPNTWQFFSDRDSASKSWEATDSAFSVRCISDN